MCLVIFMISQNLHLCSSVEWSAFIIDMCFINFACLSRTTCYMHKTYSHILVEVRAGSLSCDCRKHVFPSLISWGVYIEPGSYYDCLFEKFSKMNSIKSCNLCMHMLFCNHLILVSQLFFGQFIPKSFIFCETIIGVVLDMDTRCQLCQCRKREKKIRKEETATWVLGPTYTRWTL